MQVLVKVSREADFTPESSEWLGRNHNAQFQVHLITIKALSLKHHSLVEPYLPVIFLIKGTVTGIYSVNPIFSINLFTLKVR